jgi:hypothetical protein
MDVKPISEAEAAAVPEPEPYPELESIFYMLHATARRNRNQHRQSPWWASLSQFRRQVNNLLIELRFAHIQELRYGKGHKQARRATVDVERRIWHFTRIKPQLFQYVNYPPLLCNNATGPDDSWRRAFTALVADNQFSSIGLMLTGTLARVEKLAWPLREVEEDEEASSEAGPEAARAQSELDVGEVVQRDASAGEVAQDGASEGEVAQRDMSEGEVAQRVKSEGEVAQHGAGEGEVVQRGASEGEVAEDGAGEGEVVQRGADGGEVVRPPVQEEEGIPFLGDLVEAEKYGIVIKASLDRERQRMEDEENDRLASGVAGDSTETKPAKKKRKRKRDEIDELFSKLL